MTRFYALEKIKTVDGKSFSLYAMPSPAGDPVGLFGTQKLSEATIFHNRKAAERATHDRVGWNIIEVEKIVSFVRK